jgi:hypothetical protein
MFPLDVGPLALKLELLALFGKPPPSISKPDLEQPYN